MLPYIFRKIIHFCFFGVKLYYVGMVFFRTTRFIRKKINKHGQSEYKTVHSCLGNYQMSLDIYSYMGGCIYWAGYHHISETIYLKSFLKSNMTFIDIGANQGEFSLLASQTITEGEIFAFEPVTSNIQKFKKNVGLNNIQNITLFEFGLSNSKTSLPIYTSEASSETINEGLSTLFSTGSKNKLEQIVELEVFDDVFFDRLTSLDFVKIDIEGSELFALQGMSKTLEKFKPQILIEINQECFQAAGYTTVELLTFLKQFNYKAYMLLRGKLVEVPTLDLKWGNYIFK